ncbi:MAG: hypothetical protein AAGI24_15580 [Pseudomonadota bacterium]
MAEAQRQAALRDLVNSGLEVLHPEQLTEQTPLAIVVLGAARGGTSAVAATLDALGVSMGRGALPPVFEDLELSLAIEQGRTADAAQLILTRSKVTPWGFKRPGYSRFASDYHSQLGNVRYVAVFRDPLATAMRAQLSSEADILGTMRRTLEEYRRIKDFLHGCEAPALLVSYEKMLEAPAGFVDALADFCACPAGDRQGALACIQASPPDYLDHTRNNKSRGRLDIVERRRVRGWAQYLTHRRQADVAIEVNGCEVARVPADQYRADLAEMGVSADGRCAFDVVLQEPLQAGDVVRAVVTGDPCDIMNSPLTYQPPAGWLTRLAAHLGLRRD